MKSAMVNKWFDRLKMEWIKAACDHTIRSVLFCASVYIVNGHWLLNGGSHNAFEIPEGVVPCDLFSKLIFALEMSFSAANHDFLIRYIFNKGQPKIKQYLTDSIERNRSLARAHYICITVFRGIGQPIDGTATSFGFKVNF